MIPNRRQHGVCPVCRYHKTFAGSCCSECKKLGYKVDEKTRKLKRQTSSLVPSTGTPKTLMEAIGNGFKQSLSYPIGNQQVAIRENVKDFLSQKFCKATFKNPELSELLKGLFSELVKEEEEEVQS